MYFFELVSERVRTHSPACESLMYEMLIGTWNVDLWDTDGTIHVSFLSPSEHSNEF